MFDKQNLQDKLIVCVYDRTYLYRKPLKEMEESEDKMEQFLPYLLPFSHLISHGIGTHFYTNTEKLYKRK